MTEHEYGDVSKYHPKKLTEKVLANARTGLSAGNPAHMVLMAREIDRLRKRIREMKKMFSEKCKEMSPTGIVFGGAAALQEVEDAFDSLLTSSLKPDMVSKPVRNRFIDGVVITTWSMSKVIHKYNW